MSKTDCEAIAKRAYDKFVQRGGGHGHHEKDWLDAEKEIKEIVDKPAHRDNKSGPGAR